MGGSLPKAELSGPIGGAAPVGGAKKSRLQSRRDKTCILLTCHADVAEHNFGSTAA